MASAAAANATLLEALAGCLDADATRRGHAEAFIRRAEQQAGYAVELANVALGSQCEIGARQLAAVLLKKLVNERWSALDLADSGIDTNHALAVSTSGIDSGNANGYSTGFVVPDEDKRLLKQVLVHGLGDHEHCIRVAVGVAIAAIAYRDWPEQWPELTGILVDAVRTRRTPALVQGALGCLEIMADDIDEGIVPQMVQELMPVLPDLCMCDELSIRGHALAVVCGIISALGLLTGTHQAEVMATIAPSMPTWISVFEHTLATSDISAPVLKAKTEVLRCVIQFTLFFAKPLQAHAVPLFSSCLDLFARLVPLYVDTVVNARPSTSQPDGDEGGIETLVLQLYEVLLCLAQSRRFKDGLRPVMHVLFECSLRYMQIGARQLEEWEDDPSQFIVDDESIAEGGGLCVRSSAAALLQELLDNFGNESCAIFVASIRKQMDDARAAKASGDENWWKLRESCLFVMCYHKKYVKSSARAASQGDADGFFSIEALVTTVLKEDIFPTDVPAFLRGRAMRLGVDFVKQIKGTEQSSAFFRAALAGLHAEDMSPLRATSCVCLGRMCASLAREETKPYARTMFRELMRFLQDTDEDLIHVALECLSFVVKVDTAVSTAAVMEIGPAVLQGWSNFFNDPLISATVLEVFEAFASIPECQTSLHAFLMPAISGVLRDPNAQGTIVDGILDLVVSLLKDCNEELAQTAFVTIFAQIIEMLHKDIDDREIQGCIQCLQSFARIGGEKLDSWRVAGIDNNTMVMCSAVVDVLGSRSDSACLFVGPLLSTLLLRMPQLMNPFIGKILEAVLYRLQQCEVPIVATKLVLVFVRLAVMDAKQEIDLLHAVHAGAGSTGLSIAMQKWTQYHNELQGEYTIKLSTLGLMRVLSTLDARLQDVSVTGREIFRNPEVITTRARARQSAPSEWTHVPVPVKIISLLLDQFIELRDVKRERMSARGIDADEHGGKNDDLEDDDDDGWEECGDDDDDDIDEDFDEGDEDDDDEEEDNSLDANGMCFADRVMGAGTKRSEDIEARLDPLSAADLLSELRTFLRNLVESSLGSQIIQTYADEFSLAPPLILQALG